MQKLLVAAAMSAIAQGADSGSVKHQFLHAEPADHDVIKPMKFNQRLLICNAYANDAPVTIAKNDKETLVDGGRGIAYRECRYLENSQLASHDKLELFLKDLDVHGTFEVGELPKSDAVLLLVLSRRSGSSMVNFQSFAFPTTGHDNEAQVAVIDAFRGNSTIEAAPRMRMEDHVSEKEKKKVTRRVEQLNFNRVYAIEEGTYDASFDGTDGNKTSGHTVKLQRKQNYVMLRTGDEEVGQAQTMVVFPDPDLRSLATGRGVTLSAMLVAAFGWFM